MLSLLVIANIVPSSLIVMLMMETVRFSEMSVRTRATQHNTPEVGILHSNHRESLKSYSYEH
jgi:hypothetical protein